MESKLTMNKKLLSLCFGTLIAVAASAEPVQPVGTAEAPKTVVADAIKFGRGTGGVTSEPTSVSVFGAAGDCTGVGRGTDDSDAIEAALSWVCGGNFRVLRFDAGKRYRVSRALTANFNGAIGCKIIMDSPLTPDAGPFSAMTFQGLRDGAFDLWVLGGGQDADYTQADPTGGSQAFVFQGCRRCELDIRANGYLGRVLRTMRQGGFYKLSFLDIRLDCGDITSSRNAVPCGQACYIQGSNAFGGFRYMNIAWTKIAPVFDSVVDVVISHAEGGTVPGVRSSWEWRGCGSLWLGKILLGDESQTQTLMTFTTNAMGRGCSRIDIDTFFSVAAATALRIENNEASEPSITVKKLVSRHSRGPAVILDNATSVKVMQHDSLRDSIVLETRGVCRDIDYFLNANETRQNALRIGPDTSHIRLCGLSREASQKTKGGFAHVKVEGTGPGIDFVNFTMTGAAPAGCFELAAGNAVRLLGGRYETNIKFIKGVEPAVIDQAQGIVSKAYGTALMPSGQTAVVVSHGVFNTPSHVQATGRSADTASLWISEITPAQFTINVPLAVGGDRVIDWDAVRRP